MPNISQASIDAAAPSKTVRNQGRKFAESGSFFGLHQSSDGSLLIGLCHNEGKVPVRCISDFLEAEQPVHSCTCPNTDRLCEHSLGLMYAFAIGLEFKIAKMPKHKSIESHSRHRRQLLQRINPESSQPIVKAAIEQTSAELRLAALQCVAGDSAFVSLLVKLLNSKKFEIRLAAIQALAEIDHPQAIAEVTEILRGDDEDEIENAVLGSSRNPSRSMQVMLIAEARRLSSALLEQTATKTPSADVFELASRLGIFLKAFQGRKERPVVQFLLDCVKNDSLFQRLSPGITGLFRWQFPRLMLLSGSGVLLGRLKEMLDHSEREWVYPAVMACFVSESPAAVYKRFQGIYRSKRSTLSSRERLVAGCVSSVLSDWDLTHNHSWFIDIGEHRDDARWDLVGQIRLAHEWIEAAMEIDDVQTVLALARTPNRKSWSYLSRQCDAVLRNRKSRASSFVTDIVECMILSQHPELIQRFVAVMERFACGKDSCYDSQQLIGKIPQLPNDAVEALEAMMPRVHKDLARDFAASLSQLQAASINSRRHV